MDGFAVVEEFIGRARRLSTPDGLRGLLSDVTTEMGYDYFALLHHVDLTRYSRTLTHMERGELVAVSTYPEAWVETYVRDDIVSRDPVLIASQRTNIGFFWDEIDTLIRVTRAHRELRAATERAGIGAGFTVPAHVPGEVNGSCSFAMIRGRDPPCTSRVVVQSVGSFAFHAARVMVENAYGRPQTAFKPLSPRLLECIVLAGRGKRTGEIAQILGISPATVKRHFEIAREHYDVVTREQVIMRALFEGQVGLSDLVK